mmetsp:Transcript_29563/g.83379  ORF Transcript_29563/g.83379 Transcript_29563/m.83379 type:complete len:124 (+) Transcript_29563:63-434(+)
MARLKRKAWGRTASQLEEFRSISVLPASAPLPAVGLMHPVLVLRGPPATAAVPYVVRGTPLFALAALGQRKGGLLAANQVLVIEFRSISVLPAPAPPLAAVSLMPPVLVFRGPSAMAVIAAVA